MAVSRDEFRRMLERRVLLLDGAMATELQKAGLPSGTPPEYWVLEQPESVLRVHQQYLDGGSEVLFTCTFGASRFRLAGTGLESRVVDVNRRAAEIARRAVGTRALVAGSIGPLGCGRATGSRALDAELASAFEEQARALFEAGVDLFVAETMRELPEALAAVEAVRKTTPQLPLLLFFSPQRTPDDPDGLSDARSFLELFRELDVDAIGANCGEGPGALLDGVMNLLIDQAEGLPLAVKPSAGIPQRRESDGAIIYPTGAHQFARTLHVYVRAGARIAGGCCGTTPEHIRALKSELQTL